METQQSSMARESTSLNPLPRSSDRANLDTEINSLRTGIYILGVALLLLSVFFSLYMYKQNNLLIAQIDTQTRILNQNEPIYEGRRQRLMQMMQDLRVFAQTHSDILPILVDHDLVRIQPQPAMMPQLLDPAPPSK